MKRIVAVVAAWAAMTLCALPVFGQASATSSLSGTVIDPSGALIPGAEATAKNVATGVEFKAVSTENGTFAMPVLDIGVYTVTVALPGFKQSILNNVKLDVGVPAAIRVTLEVGGVTESVSVEAGAEVLQSQTANIATTLEVSQISNLPLVSRDPLNFVTLLPGVNTASINRNSTINGLPTSALDITLDGINIQDNFNKSTDGFFNRVPTSLDTVEEVTVSSATNDALSGAQGAAQIKFVTRSGSNDFHGSLYEYHRNPVLNSNYWFNNRDVAPDPNTGKAPRARVLFNQYGGRIGGPIIRNKAFFFFNYEELRQPSSVNRQRTILTPLTQTGVFQYNTANGVRTVDLLALAAANGQTTTQDPVVAKLLADIRSATSNTGGITALTDPNILRFSYSPTGISIVKRPTTRFDVNVTEKHHVSVSWAYYDGRGGPDFLNNVEPQFPGFPNYGQQPADRYVGSAALRSTLSSTLVNEVRSGLSGGPSRFNPLASAGDFSGTVANQAGFSLGINAADGINIATATSAPSRRNPLIRDISDTLNWTRGAHSLSFGGKFDWVTLTYQSQTLVPSITFGVDTTDPANAMFTATNFPGSSSTDLTNAKGIYSVLTGRVTAINANVRLNEATGKYVYLGTGVERSRQKELGLFAQDSWRVRPTLTLNYGVRWEIQGSFYPMNSNYTTASIADLWGISGVGHLFSPGVTTGQTPQFVQFKSGTPSYDTQYSNFAPSFGFAWNPRATSTWMKRIFGDQGTVIRGGYAIAYSRRGIGEWRGLVSANPGLTLTTNRDLTTGNLVGGSLGSEPILLRETGRLGPPAFSDTPTYPFVGPITSSINVFDPHLKVPYAESWSFGIQRQIDKNSAVEVRYVGTRFLQGWTTYNLNAEENNIVENGVLNEFKLAQANLQANIAAGKGNTFAYTGAPGTSALPIALAYFSGLPASQAGNTANYTSSNFTSSTFTTPLAVNNPIVCNSTGSGACATASYSNQLDTNATFRTNATNAGLPANFMLTNPAMRGGANLLSTGGYNRYDGMQVDFHRRLSNGLLVGANYQFAKAFSSQRVSFRTQRVNALDTSTVRNAFKLNWVYQMPFGSGKPLFSNAGGALNRIIGGWEFEGTGRIQSGQLFDFGASSAGPVRPVGMTTKELQDMYGLYFDNPNKIIYSLPPDVISNTIKAFNTSATSATGYGALGAPTGKYLAPGSYAGCVQVYPGQCAPQNVFVTGPRFTRFDLSLVKRVNITEHVNFELRGEFLNAFNNINFQNPTGSSFTNPTNATFGQVTTAYSDLSNTNDPGGRLGQIVARINF
jgi:Carboxypeptidase regulatory-like domain